MKSAGVLPCLLVFHPFKELSLLKLLKLRLLSLEPCSFPKASAKVELFTIHTKYSSNFFRENFQENHNILKIKYFPNRLFKGLLAQAKKIKRASTQKRQKHVKTN